MKFAMRVTTLLLTLISLTIPAMSFASGEEEIPKVLVETGYNIVNVNNQKLLAVSFKNHPHWHTYWKNPGDAGLPINNKFSLNSKDVNLEELSWPRPQRFIENGNLWAYGYEGEYTLFYNTKNLKPGELKVTSTWLVCKHICIPGKVETVLDYNGNSVKVKSSKPADIATQTVKESELKTRFGKLPKKVSDVKNLEIVFTPNKKQDGFILFYTLNQSKTLGPGLNLITPFKNEMFTWGHESLFTDRKGNLYGRMEVEWNGEYEEPEIPFPKNGKFDKPYTISFLLNNPGSEVSSIFNKTFTELNSGARERLENLIGMLKGVELNQKVIPEANAEDVKRPEGENSKSFFYYLIMAFLGGLILNVMPCVLPVISIKLFGLIKNRDSNKLDVLKHNFSYSAGILFTFLVLGAVILGLKSAGQTVGWGFQLQSPKFVAVIILVLFIFTLNLFGLFEFKTPGGSVFGNLSIKEGMIGDFLSGILAVILSTPCSAPFLGTALTFAFTSDNFTILMVLESVGLGLAFPFIITGIFPKTVSFLPKPGKWMEDLKKFLGLTLVLTSIWLLDVFQALTDGTLPMIKLNTLLALTFFAFYFRKNMTTNAMYRVGAFLLPAVFAFNLFSSQLSVGANSAGTDMIVDKRASEGLAWEPWSEEKMLEYSKEGHLVFIDFTAKWCFTCKVNEKLVLDTRGFKDLTKKRNIKLLLGDWTKRDPKIGNWLKSQGMVGVPAYFIQKTNGTLVNLGETITLEKIEKNLD